MKRVFGTYPPGSGEASGKPVEKDVEPPEEAIRPLEPQPEPTEEAAPPAAPQPIPIKPPSAYRSVMHRHDEAVHRVQERMQQPPPPPSQR